MLRSTLNSITASLDWDDFMASSFGETNTASVATTSSASQPIFSISSDTHISSVLSSARTVASQFLAAFFMRMERRVRRLALQFSHLGRTLQMWRVPRFQARPLRQVTSLFPRLFRRIRRWEIRCSPHFGQPPLMAISTPSSFVSPAWPAPGNSTFAPSVGKAFVVGPGYAPIPAKLVAKITSGIFVELADLLAEN